MNQGTILIVEDDTTLRHTLSTALRVLGFETFEAQSGELGLAELRNHKMELVLLDLNMPGMGGIATCKKMRAAHPRLPIIVLTVRDHVEDKVSALDAGADDYVTKPFLLPELSARIRSGIRRVRQTEEDPGQIIEVGDLTIDPLAHRLMRRGIEVHLTPKEFELLLVLMKSTGNPIAHHRLLVEVWGSEFGDEREYLRTYISQLRRKIEDDPSNPRYLLTENYFGYRFVVPVE